MRLIKRMKKAMDPAESSVEEVLAIGEEIRCILDSETHNGVTKEDLLCIADWLWHQMFMEADE